ncbi:hypothetical protein MaudCBS49596_002048 [Microsporum audouinii]
MVARRQACEDALNELTAMANKTMIATGRWFRRPDRGTHELKRHIPPAHEQFQRALDRLQQEIFLAKALLEKDYHAIREKKAATNRAQQGGDAAVGDQPVAPAPAAPSSSTEPPVAPPAAAPAVDGALLPTTEPAPTATPAPTTQPADTQVQPSLPPSEPTAVPTISPPLTTAAAEPVQPPTTATGDAPAPVSNDTSPDLPSTTAEPMAHTRSSLSHASGSIGSLLPGLETYANTGEEAILDLLPTNGQPNNQVNQVNGQVNGQANGQTSIQQNNQSNVQNQNNTTTENPRRDVVMEDVPESNFDDLFVGSGDFGGDADDLMLNTAEMTELDDSWFQ